MNQKKKAYPSSDNRRGRVFLDWWWFSDSFTKFYTIRERDIVFWVFGYGCELGEHALNGNRRGVLDFAGCDFLLGGVLNRSCFWARSTRRFLISYYRNGSENRWRNDDGSRSCSDWNVLNLLRCLSVLVCTQRTKLLTCSSTSAEGSACADKGELNIHAWGSIMDFVSGPVSGPLAARWRARVDSSTPILVWSTVIAFSRWKFI